MIRTGSNSLEALQARSELTSFLHSDYKYYHPEWVMIRDSLAGERRVKEKGTDYLPSLDVEYGTSYETYKQRATYVNMVARTVLGLVGTIFRRPLKAENANKADLDNVTINGLDLNLFAKKLAYEICSVGRVGVLVDMTAKDQRVYMTEYVAENILSWQTTVINGREVLSYVLLREIVSDVARLDDSTVAPSNPWDGTSSLRARYRLLLLDNGVYKQRLYNFDPTDESPSFLGKEYEEVTPTRNGKPFDFIPMVIVGPFSPTPEVQKSPVYDITALNMAHYRTSAQLEHGRYYTALPVYYVPIAPGQETGDYHVGPSVVWEVGPDMKPGVLEYYGTGLKSLTDSLTEKEEHIAQLGGRIMGIRPQATAESDNIFALKQANEMSILLNITESLSLALTRVFTWYLDWQRKPIKGIKIKLNQDFKSLNIAARELRAVALLYQEGIIPIQSVYETLQASEFISEDITLEEFKEMLSDLKNFPNQPDVAAMHAGYPDASSRLRDDMAERQQSVLQEEAALSREQQLLLQDDMFEQGKVTAQYEHGLTKDLETHKSKLKKSEMKAAPKPAQPLSKKSGKQK